MTSAITPEMRLALADVTDPGERAYVLWRVAGSERTAPDVAQYREAWGRTGAGVCSAWADVAAELRAEALREAIAVAEGVRDRLDAKAARDVWVALRALAGDGGER